jgi:radical SAM protein with 4Fe4S-binding SPASM domain
MFSEEFLKKEVYCISLQGGNTLVYAPLTRFFAIYEGPVSTDEAREELKDAYSQENVPSFVRERGFVFDTNKIRFRLNITSGCNLCCSYCSVNADNSGKFAKNIPDSVAFMAVKFFIEYAVKNRSKELEVVFSGGEPTLRIKQIKEIIDFLFDNTKQKNLKISPRLITNGLFSQDELVPILHYFREIQVSWDGSFPNHPRYGNHYAILADRVLDNISWLLDKGVAVSVLMVVSEYNYRILRDVVDTLYGRGVRHIFLSLENNLGRAKDHIADVDMNILAWVYLDIWKYYRDRGVDINLGGTDVHSISPFPCSVPIPNYSVSPDGTISSCTTAFNDSSDAVDDFRIGVVTESGASVDHGLIKKMHQFQVTNIPACSNCFIKWHCRGGCIYSKQGDWFSPLPAEICSLFRTIVMRKILTIIDEQKK